jgi:hypothetical protein
MKNKSLLFIATCLICACFPLHAQNEVQYKVTRDDPNDICNFWLFLDPLQMDFGFQNIHGLSLNTGVAGIGLVKQRFGFDYGVRFGTLTLYGLGNANVKRTLQLELGGLFTLKDKTRMKSNTKIILDISESTNQNGDRVETTKFIRIPAQQRIIVHARGGLYLKRNPFVRESGETGTEIEGNLTCVGLYIGLSRMTVSNVFLNTNTDGKASRSGILRVYADVIVCPVRSLVPFGTSEQATNKDVLSSPVGFRMGFYGMPCEDRKTKKKGGGIAVGCEVGFRPGDGLYMTGSFMFVLMRKKMTALGYKRPEGVNEKGQQIEKE